MKKISLAGDAQLAGDMERYRQKALELGATQARIVPVPQIPVEDAVVLKCRVPRCFGYGVCANCPPHTLKPLELREYLQKYDWAVFFTKDVQAEVIVRDKAIIKERVAAYQEISKIVSEIESMAFYDGYYLAFGFGAGSCRHTFCGKEDSCLALEGKKCRFALLARPSMEAVGIDVFRMVAQAGWEIYPVGSGAKADEVPKGVLAGLVVIR
jgi:predicted metal-binding protein